MKSRKISADVIWLLALLLVFCFLSFQIASRSSGDADASLLPHRTTISSQQDGWKAFYLTLQQSSNRRVDRWTRGGPSTWPDDAAIMICGPAYGESRWTEDEARAALKWVSQGGSLVILSDADDALADEVGLDLKASDEKSVTDSYVAAQPAPFFAGVKSVVVPAASGWHDSSGAAGASLLSGKSKLSVMLGHGKGWIVAVGSPAVADNVNLGKADNATFLVQLINSIAQRPEKRATGRILFDEFHQGYADENNLWSAIGKPGRLAFYQLAVLVLLLAYSVSRRFGLPRPAPEASRVSSEYVTSLANLYQRARASDAALDSIYRGFRRDLASGTGLPSDARIEELVPEIASGLGLSATDPVVGRLQQLTDICESKIKAGPKAVPESELLQLTRNISDMRKELRLGRNFGG